MAANGFDIHELEEYQKEIIRQAKAENPKEIKKFLRKEVKKLNTQNKKTYASCGIGEETGNLIGGFRVGKLYTKGSKTNYAIRAFNNSPHAHLQNNGWVWKPHKENTGVKGLARKTTGRYKGTIKEKFIPGFKFLEKANEQFEGKYNENCEKFVNDVLSKGL